MFASKKSENKTLVDEMLSKKGVRNDVARLAAAYRSADEYGEFLGTVMMYAVHAACVKHGIKDIPEFFTDCGKEMNRLQKLAIKHKKEITGKDEDGEKHPLEQLKELLEQLSDENGVEVAVMGGKIGGKKKKKKSDEPDKNDLLNMLNEIF